MEFIRHNRAWYAESNPRVEGCTEEIMLIVEGSAEVMIRWYDVEGIERAPKIEAWNDGWRGLFFTWAPILGLLIDKDMTPDEFEAFLVKKGVKDATPVESPYA